MDHDELLHTEESKVICTIFYYFVHKQPIEQKHTGFYRHANTLSIILYDFVALFSLLL